VRSTTQVMADVHRLKFIQSPPSMQADRRTITIVIPCRVIIGFPK
jgi:hypothetical protein